MQRWDRDDTREVAKGVAVAALTVLATKLIEWGIDVAKRTVEQSKQRPGEPPDAYREPT